MKRTEGPLNRKGSRVSKGVAQFVVRYELPQASSKGVATFLAESAARVNKEREVVIEARRAAQLASQAPYVLAKAKAAMRRRTRS